MKTLVSLLCCTALTVGSASAQSYRVARAGAFEENGRVEVGIPTSPLAVDLTVEKEVVTVGPYARYAQKFLGVRGALSDKTLYSVKAARVALLDRDATTASEVPAGEVRATSYLGDAETFSRVPFDKRSLVDESLETAARNAANTLFAIRRHRMELITSEAGEHVFGAGLQAALAELDRQDVRELRMAALTIADPVSVTPDNVDEWFVGRMPEELIEELALRLLSRCGRPVLDTLCGRWLRAGSGAERYAALMALARARVQEFDAAAVVEAVPDAVAACPDDLRLARGAAAFVQSASARIAPERLARMIERLPDSRGGAYLRDELAWMIL